MPKKPMQPEWYLVDGVARVWDGESWLSYKWTEPKGWYDFQGEEYYWDGKEWYSDDDEDEVDEDEDDDEEPEESAEKAYGRSAASAYTTSYKSSNSLGVIPKILIIVGLGFALNFAWHFFTDSPSTTSVCFTFSKATDFLLPEEETSGAAQWWADNIKTEEDFARVDTEVLNALRLYGTGEFLDDVDPYSRMGLRDNVLEACELAEPGSTEH
jgi:hypothetical protein